MSAPITCVICDSTGFVCENCGTRWELTNGETCCGAGHSCACNPDGNYEFDAVIATTDTTTVKEWVH